MSDTYTLTACKRCNGGVRPSYAVAGMCPACAADRIEELEARVKDLEGALEKIAHAIIDCAQTILDKSNTTMDDWKQE